MSVDKHLLEILVCPATKTPVQLLAKDKLAILNREVGKGAISYVDGSPVEAPLEEALITEDGRTLYRVSDGIPVMLEEQGISAKQVPGW
jgi:uncharacterized protein